MKIASFVVDGRRSYGLVGENGMIDLAGRMKEPNLRALLGAGGLDLARAYMPAVADFGLDEVRFLPVVPAPEHVVGVGTNYASHIAEVAKAGVQRDRPRVPSVFLRTAGSLAGHGQPLLLPRVSRCLDFEGELAIIIGAAGRYISGRDALSHVAGYACFNDGSIRDWQFHTNNITPGKNFPLTGGLGPWLVTRDEVPDPHRLRIRTRLNGDVVQDGNTSAMIFDVPQIISYVSSFIALVPGDVIATGTPEGVGFSRKPPLYMAEGDVCQVEIESVGTLISPVRAEE